MKHIITAAACLWLGFWILAGGYAMFRFATCRSPLPIVILLAIAGISCAAVSWLEQQYDNGQSSD